MKKKLVAGILILSLAMPVIVQAKRTPALNKKKVSIKVGKRIQLKVKNKGKRKIKWSSTKKKIASVNKKGLVTAKKAGTAKIKAKVGRKTLTCKVTVKKRTVKNPSQAGKTSSGGGAKTTPKPTTKPKVTPKPTKNPNSIGSNPTENPKHRDDGWVPGWY